VISTAILFQNLSSCVSTHKEKKYVVASAL
jgi:hypothetical protein